MIPASMVLREARRFLGQRYVFGAEGDRQPASWVGPVDCSELVQIACQRAGVIPLVPDGAYYQWRHTAGRRLDVGRARTVAGALLFVGTGQGVGRQAITHVGLSLGDGRTFEARGSAWPVGEFPKRSGWTFAGLMPGVDYSEPGAQQMPAARMDRAKADQIVEALYRQILGRPADLSGAAHWGQQLAEGLISQSELADVLTGALNAEQTQRLDAAMQAIGSLGERVTALESRPAAELPAGVYRIERAAVM